MKTDVITVSSNEKQIEKALDQVEAVAAYKGLSEKNASQLRLLTEEMLGMFRSIVGESTGKFWIEDSDGEYRLHLLVNTRMNREKRDQLLSAASSGKNEAAKGLMGKLRDFFCRTWDGEFMEGGEGASDPTAPGWNLLAARDAAKGAMYSPYFMLTPSFPEQGTAVSLDYEWSMTGYREELESRRSKNDEKAEEAWDELEKSVVAHIADEVKVGILGDDVEMIIFKKIP